MSDLQEEHYNSIYAEYDAHYFDDTNMDFREKFFYTSMFENLDLKDKIIADLACSSGYNSKFVLEQFPETKVIGFDISSVACEAYSKNTNSNAYKLDLTAGSCPYNIKVDIVMIIGGLHHCITNLQGAFSTIKAMLKPGGYLLMVEPNSACIFEGIRKLWYKCDKYFESNSEHALNHKELLSTYGQDFKLVDIKYKGGPAYFIIYNSLVLRVPVKLKRFIAPSLMLIEYLYNKLPGKLLFPYFVARWQLN